MKWKAHKQIVISIDGNHWFSFCFLPSSKHVNTTLIYLSDNFARFFSTAKKPFSQMKLHNGIAAKIGKY